jgi:hypothetical protein
MLLMGRGLVGGDGRVRSRILTTEGRQAHGGELRLLSATAGEPGAPDVLVGRLLAGTLPPGDYLLEVILGDARGRPRAAIARAFRIVAAAPAG